MKEVKDTRYHGRISSVTKARWEAAKSEGGYRGLAAFIEDAVEEKIERGRSAEDPAKAPPYDPPKTIVTEVTVVPGKAIPMTDAGTAALAADSPAASGFKPDPKAGKHKGCSREAQHRKGIYCKSCRKVVR